MSTHAGAWLVSSLTLGPYSRWAFLFTFSFFLLTKLNYWQQGWWSWWRLLEDTWHLPTAASKKKEEKLWGPRDHRRLLGGQVEPKVLRVAEPVVTSICIRCMRFVHPPQRWRWRNSHPTGARDASGMLSSSFFLTPLDFFKNRQRIAWQHRDVEPDEKKAQEMDNISWATGEFFFLVSFSFYQQWFLDTIG